MRPAVHKALQTFVMMLVVLFVLQLLLGGLAGLLYDCLPLIVVITERVYRLRLHMQVGIVQTC